MSLRYSFQIILFQRYDAIEALSGYNVRQTALGFAHIERLSNFSLFYYLLCLSYSVVIVKVVTTLDGGLIRFYWNIILLKSDSTHLGWMVLFSTPTSG